MEEHRAQLLMDLKDPEYRKSVIVAACEVDNHRTSIAQMAVETIQTMSLLRRARDYPSSIYESAFRDLPLSLTNRVSVYERANKIREVWADFVQIPELSEEDRAWAWQQFERIERTIDEIAHSDFLREAADLAERMEAKIAYRARQVHKNWAFWVIFSLFLVTSALLTLNQVKI